MSRTASRLPLLLLAVVVVGGAGYLAWRMLDAPGLPDDSLEPVAVRPAVDLPDAPVMDITPLDPDRPPPRPETPGGATVTGRVVTPELRAVGAGRVELQRGTPLNLPGGGSLERLGFQAEIDEFGFFAFTDVPPLDELAVHIDGETFAAATHGPFATRPEQLLDLGDLIVRPGLIIRGNVVDPRGRPVPGARVGLYNLVVRNLGGVVSMPDPLRLQFTDDDGRFEFRHAPHSPFSLAVTADGYANAVHEHGTVIDESVPALDVSVGLREIVPLVGQLVDSRTGEPLPDQEVVAHPASPEHGRSVVTTDADGRFRFEELSPARYNLWADPQGYSRGGVIVDADGWNQEVRLGLRRAGRLMGSVIKPDGSPVRAFDVQLLKHGTRQMPGSPVGRHQRVKDPEGEFACDDLEPGWYSVEVWAKGYALTRTQQQMVKVKKGQTVSGFVVTVQLGAGLIGRVVNDLGEPIVGARVSLHTNNMSQVEFLRDSDVQPSWMAKGHTDRDGWFQLDELTAGVYQLQVDHSEHPVVRINDVRARAGTLIELEPIELARPGTLQGVAVDGAGAPQAEATIWVSAAGQATRQVRTDGRGRYVMRRLPPGAYQVVGAPSKPKLADAQRMFQAELGRVMAQRQGRAELVDLAPGQVLEYTVVVDA